MQGLCFEYLACGRPPTLDGREKGCGHSHTVLQRCGMVIYGCPVHYALDFCGAQLPAQALDLDYGALLLARPLPLPLMPLASGDPGGLEGPSFLFL